MSPTIRLLCALLTLMLALPAAQARACAVDMPAAGHGAHHAMAGSHPDPGHHNAGDRNPGHTAPVHHAPAGQTQHECVGCIAPIDVGFYRPVDAPRLTALRTAGPAGASALLTHVAAPEPPPPRATV